jgi:hypothetical protein
MPPCRLAALPPYRLIAVTAYRFPLYSLSNLHVIQTKDTAAYTGRAFIS